MRAIIISMFLLYSLNLAIAADDEARYAEINRHALNAPPSATKSIDALSSYLTKPFTTDEEKARAIFRWIADNISYDVEDFFSGRTPKSGSGDVLKSRSSVCAGYSSLFEALGKRAGLEVATINGYAKGFGYRAGDNVTGESNHAWNAVKINGEWKLIDCTWGAGRVDEGHQYRKEFEPYYFFTRPEEFIYRHLPTDKRWQLLPTPVSLEAFQDLPFVYPVFFQCGLNMASVKSSVLDVSGEYIMEFFAPPEVQCMANLEQDGKEIKSAVFLQRSESTFHLRIMPPNAGEYFLNIFAKKKMEPGLYPLAVSYKITARTNSTKSGSYPFTFEVFLETEAQLKSPLCKELPSGSTQTFSLISPGAEKVAVVCGDEWDFLKKDGNRFEGKVEISAGKVAVLAQYPGKNEFQELLEYNGTGNFKRAPAPVKYEKFMDSDAEVLAPLRKYLPVGIVQVFRLKLPGAIKAAVVARDKWQFLEKNGDYFEGKIEIVKGKIMVCGAYTNTTHFEGLLEYEGQ